MFKLQSLKEATTTQGFIAALEALIAAPDADRAAVVQAALKCKREHKVREWGQGCGFGHMGVQPSSGNLVICWLI